MARTVSKVESLNGWKIIGIGGKPLNGMRVVAVGGIIAAINPRAIEGQAARIVRISLPLYTTLVDMDGWRRQGYILDVLLKLGVVGPDVVDAHQVRHESVRAREEARWMLSDAKKIEAAGFPLTKAAMRRLEKAAAVRIPSVAGA